jgi:hypothetical protein
MPGTSDQEAQAGFPDIQTLRNHWARPAGPRAYYWYLTFEDAAELHALVDEYREATALPYYDAVYPSDLHLTLDRVAYENSITASQISAIETAAIGTCSSIQCFRLKVGHLGGTRGAIGFNVYPEQHIRALRSALRSATFEVYPEEPISASPPQPHITIAYSNADDMPAETIIGVADRLNAQARRADIVIREVILVLLERRERSYNWHAISRIRLADL